MFATLTQVSISDRDEAEKLLREQLLPAVSQAPGFVSGTWMNIGGNQGASLILWESEDSANGFKDNMEGNPPPGGFVTIESVEVGEVVGQA